MQPRHCRARTAPRVGTEMERKRWIPLRNIRNRRPERAKTVIELSAVQVVPAYNEDYRFAGLLSGQMLYIWPLGGLGAQP